MNTPAGPAQGIAALAGWKLTAAFVAGALVGAVSAVQMVPNFRGTSAEDGAAAFGGSGGTALDGVNGGVTASGKGGGAKGAGSSAA
ncbi:MAG: hypothetical protein M3323_01350, partial [Actinomycetota bacterium]|nr:hypothetical protein [Actinomycetota bacterium]